MDNFSYTDNVRAAFASCLPCFTASRSESASNSASNPSSNAEPRSASTIARPSSSNDLEHLLRDSDSDALSLHSNLGTAAHRRARHRRPPKFSLTLFGYTLFGRPPIYLSDDEDGNDSPGIGGRTARVLVTASSSTLDSDPAAVDASTIERLTSPDHIAALAAQRESERRELDAEEARRKVERRARRQERKARARASALVSLNGTPHPPDVDTFEGFQGNGNGMIPTSFPFHPVEVVPDHPDPESLGRNGDFDGSCNSYSGDADDADLGGELYTRNKKKSSAVLSASGSDSRSRTSASFSAGDASHTQNFPVHSIHQSIPYPHTEMHVPAPVKKKSHRTSKRTSTVSSVTSASTAPYTPVESITETAAVAAFPVPQERYGTNADFPSVGLSGMRSPKSLDPRAFLAHQG